jgi:hypothetical protein
LPGGGCLVGFNFDDDSIGFRDVTRENFRETVVTDAKR